MLRSTRTIIPFISALFMSCSYETSVRLEGKFEGMPVTDQKKMECYFELPLNRRVRPDSFVVEEGGFMVFSRFTNTYPTRLACGLPSRKVHGFTFTELDKGRWGLIRDETGDTVSLFLFKRMKHNEKIVVRNLIITE